VCCCQNTTGQTVTIQIVMYVQCAQHYCKTKCVAVRTHRYRPSQYNLLCTFSVHNITVTHNVLLSEHTGTDRHNIIIQTFNSWLLYIINLSLNPPCSALKYLIRCWFLSYFITEVPVNLHTLSKFCTFFTPAALFTVSLFPTARSWTIQLLP
jgi:hypothetical protein